MEFFPLDSGQLRGRGVGGSQAGLGWAVGRGRAGAPWGGGRSEATLPAGSRAGEPGRSVPGGGTGRRQRATGGGGWRGWREEEEGPRAAEEGEDGEAGAGAGGGHWVSATLELRSGESAEPEGDGTWAGLQGPQGRRQLAWAWNSGFWLG
jgi:hypothetical protein